MDERKDKTTNDEQDRASQALRAASTPGAPGAAGTGDTREAAESSPAPYDVAEPGTPSDRVIKKGERERPGPTADELKRKPSDEPGKAPDDEHTRRRKAVEATEHDH